MGIETVASLIETLDGSRLLSPEQLREVAQGKARFPDPRALAKDLLQRGWLTPFQVNQLFQGRIHELVLGSYVLLERLGEGGMGQVFKARHQKLGRIVALKVIRKDRLTNAAAVGRFRREIHLVAQMSHPNVVMAYDADFAADGCYISLEYVEGTDLAKMVKRDGPLPVAKALDYLRQSALGLQHAHERGLVHRDIKPSNLLITKAGQVKLLDLGLARLRQDGSKEEASMTMTQMGIVVGTPDFISPEQARNAHTADIRADLYSLGCTFFYALTGQVLFLGKSTTEKLFSHCFEEPRPINQLRPDVPPHLAAVLRKLLAKKPEDRFQTPAEVVAALDNPSAVVSPPPPAVAPTAAPLTAGPVPVAVPLASSLLASTPSEADGLTVPQAIAAPPSPATVPPWRHWREHKGLLLKVGGGVLGLGLVILIFSRMFGGSSPPATKPTDGGGGAERPLIEHLDAAAIPPDEYFPWQKEVVAVLGTHRRRHWGPAYCVAMSPDGRRVASGGADKVVRLWDVPDLREQTPLKTDPPTEVRCLAYSRDGNTLAAGGGDGGVRLWDVAPRGRPPASPRLLRGPGSSLTSVALSSDGNYVAAGGTDGTVRLWSLVGAERPALLRNHDRRTVSAVAFSSDGKVLASAGYDGTVQLYDVKDAYAEKDPAVVIKAHAPEVVTALAFSPDGKTLATTGGDRYVRFWNVSDGSAATRAALPQLRWSSPLLAYSPNGKLLAFATWFGGPGRAAFGVSVWDVSKSEPAEVARLEGNTADVRGLSFGPDNRTLATVGDNAVRLWDTVTGKELAPDNDKKACGIRALAFGRDGQTLITGGHDHQIRVWRFGSKQPTEATAVSVGEGVVDALALAPDGKALATGGWNHTLQLWDVAGGKLKAGAQLPGHNAAVTAVVFAPDAKTLLSGSLEGANPLRPWAVPGGKARTPLAGPRNGVHALAFAPDGKHFAAAGREPVARVYDADGAAFEEVDHSRGLGGFGLWVYDLAFSPDSKRLATAGSDHTVRFWDLSTGKPREAGAISDLPGPAGVNTLGLAFSPDGRLLAGGQEGRVVVWEAGGGRKKLWEHELPGQVVRVQFAPDGRYLATVNGNGTVYIYRLPAAVK